MRCCGRLFVLPFLKVKGSYPEFFRCLPANLMHCWVTAALCSLSFFSLYVRAQHCCCTSGDVSQIPHASSGKDPEQTRTKRVFRHFSRFESVPLVALLTSRPRLVSSWGCPILVPFSIDGRFAFWNLQRFLDAVELRHISCLGDMMHMFLMRLSFLSAAVAEQRSIWLLGAAEHRHSRKFPRPSILVDTRHCSSFARASEITLRWYFLRVKHRRLIFLVRFLRSGLFLHPSLRFFSLIIFAIPGARSCRVVGVSNLLWVDHFPMCVFLGA